MNDITSTIDFLNSSPPVFQYISIIISLILIVVGLRLKVKSKGKSIAGWICIGIGSLSIVSNALQLFFRV